MIGGASGMIMGAIGGGLEGAIEGFGQGTITGMLTGGIFGGSKAATGSLSGAAKVGANAAINAGGNMAVSIGTQTVFKGRVCGWSVLASGLFGGVGGVAKGVKLTGAPLVGLELGTTVVKDLAKFILEWAL